MGTDTRSQSTPHQDLQPEQDHASLRDPELQLQLETRERLVRLEEENRHLREKVTDLNDKHKRLRCDLDEKHTISQQQLSDRAGKLSSRIDTLSRRLDRLFGFWMISTMLLMLFVIAVMFRAGH
ncbi:hypothetical protein [Oceanospirillum sp.]|uniref:hypothetical protein n=1 Tax=Oceanospirillum sp. TaxID=2021254 RepID=UPI003A8EBA8D